MVHKHHIHHHVEHGLLGAGAGGLGRGGDAATVLALVLCARELAHLCADAANGDRKRTDRGCGAARVRPWCEPSGASLRCSPPDL